MKTFKTLQEAYEQVAGVSAPNAQAPQAPNTNVPQATEADELDQILNQLVTLKSSELVPIINKLYGADAAEQVLWSFIRQKSQKYQQYTPQQRQQYAAKFKAAMGLQ